MGSNVTPSWNGCDPHLFLDIILTWPLLLVIFFVLLQIIILKLKSNHKIYVIDKNNAWNKRVIQYLKLPMLFKNIRLNTMLKELMVLIYLKLTRIRQEYFLCLTVFILQFLLITVFYVFLNGMSLIGVVTIYIFNFIFTFFHVDHILTFIIFSKNDNIAIWLSISREHFIF